MTDFGYQRVAPGEKGARVRAVFDSVANRYDVMNDLMSMGAHRLWKRFMLDIASIQRGQHVLDVAAGTGDISMGLARAVGSSGLVVMSDINEAMLARGRDRMINAGMTTGIVPVLADAERLPFAARSFDCVTIAFGLRNVTDKARALDAMREVLKPGGQLLVLEFSRPKVPVLGPIYDAYSFQVLPRLGRLVAGDADSYRYLAESIRMHPDQEALLQLMQQAGLEDCRYHNLAGGIVALHRGWRY